MTHGEQDVERVRVALHRAIFTKHMWTVDGRPGQELYDSLLDDLARAALAAMPTPSPVTSEVTGEQVEAAKADLSIQALALAWMDHLGYTSEQVTEAEAWRAPREGEEPEDYDGPPQAVSDLDWACEFAREIVDPAVDRLLRAAGVVGSPEGGEG